MTPSIDRLRTLALTFPSIERAVQQDAIEPDLTPEELEAWLPYASVPGQLAAHFCLHVWDRRPFDLSRSLQVWDAQHRAAFAAWAAEPGHRRLNTTAIYTHPDLAAMTGVVAAIA